MALAPSTNLTYVCHNCMQAAEKMKLCSSCHSTSYCSSICQAKDWSDHKQFCERRDRDYVRVCYETCLAIIESNKNMIFTYLFYQTYIRRESFLAVDAVKNQHRFVPFSFRKALNKVGVELSEKKYQELTHTIGTAISIEEDRIQCKGVPVLYLNKTEQIVFLLGSVKCMALAESVGLMPQPLCRAVMADLVQENIRKSSISDFLKFCKLIGQNLESKDES